MRSLPVIASLLFTLVWPLHGPVTAQNDSDTVRGAWIGGRKKPARRPARRPHPPRSSDPKSEQLPEAADETPALPISLGLTLYRLEGQDGSVRVNVEDVFRDGDKLRLQLEPGVDGYIYVFYTENGANPTMIYPDFRIDEGDNHFSAHQLAEVPSRENPRFNCFKLSGGPAVERLYVFLSREPLAGVPRGHELLRLCGSTADACPWRPSDSSWTALVRNARPAATRDTKVEEGAPQSENEILATTRDISLSSTDEEPTVIVACSSPGYEVLVQTIDIVHR